MYYYMIIYTYLIYIYIYIKLSHAKLSSYLLSCKMHLSFFSPVTDDSKTNKRYFSKPVREPTHAD